MLQCLQKAWHFRRSKPKPFFHLERNVTTNVCMHYACWITRQHCPHWTEDIQYQSNMPRALGFGLRRYTVFVACQSIGAAENNKFFPFMQTPSKTSHILSAPSDQKSTMPLCCNFHHGISVPACDNKCNCKLYTCINALHFRRTMVWQCFLT